VAGLQLEKGGSLKRGHSSATPDTDFVLRQLRKRVRRSMREAEVSPKVRTPST